MAHVKDRKDLVLYLLTLAGSLFLYSTLAELSYETRTFPATALLCLTVVCVIGILRSLSFASLPKKDAKPQTEKLMKFCFALVGTIIYALTLPLVGFYASSFVLLILLALLLGNKRYFIILLTNVIFLVLLYGVFTGFLNVPLPKGILF